MYDLVVSSMFHNVVQTSPLTNLKMFPSPQHLYLVGVTTNAFYPYALGATNLLFAALDFPTWIHHTNRIIQYVTFVSVFFYLACVFKIHPCSMYQDPNPF